MSAAPLEAQGRLVINYTSPVELLTDRFLDDALRLIAKVGARRVVLDSLTSMALSVVSVRPCRRRSSFQAVDAWRRMAKSTPLSNLMVSLMDKAGYNTDKFGQSSGRVEV